MANKNTGEESEHHVVGVKFRVTGSGSLDLRLEDLSNVQTQDLVSLTMSTATRFEPIRLANFQSQRIRLRVGTDQINEYFNIRRVILFAKPVAVEYPGF